MTWRTTAPSCLCLSVNRSFGKSSIAGGVQFCVKLWSSRPAKVTIDIVTQKWRNRYQERLTDKTDITLLMLRRNEERENIKQKTKTTAYEISGVWKNIERRKLKMWKEQNWSKRGTVHKLHITSNRSKGKRREIQENNNFYQKLKSIWYICKYGTALNICTVCRR